MLKGNDIIFTLNDAAFAASKSCEYTEKVEVIEIASYDTHGYRSYISNLKEWSLISNHLVGNISDFHDMVGKIFNVKIGVMTEGKKVITENLSGNTICVQAKITATRHNMAQGSFSFVGTGELKKIEV